MIILTILLIASVISIMWVGGIDYMKNNHPDYKGEDFFNEDDKKEIS